MIRTTILLMGALVLGSCSGSPADNSKDGEAPEAPSASVALTAKGAPKRANGYWELTITGAGGTVMGTQFLCVGGDSEERAPVFDQIAMDVNCSKHEFTRTGEGWSFDTVCGPMNASTKGSIVGDFTQRYRIEMTESDGSMSLKRTVVARHAGSCPAGVMPGDLMDDRGAKITNTLP